MPAEPWSIPSAGFTITCASASRTGAISAASTACPKTDVRFVKRSEILDFEEIERFARIAVGLGISKLRVTGRRAAGAARSAGADRAPGGHSGHPRPGADHQRRAAGGAWPGRCTKRDCAASTCTWIRSTANASRRSRGATNWAACWTGLEAARRAGFPIKLNAVAVKNLVEPDIVPLARYARERGFEVRYIEFMPLDAQNLWDRGKVLLADEIIETLSREISPLAPVPDPDPRAPASEYEYADGGGRVGFIASVSRPFCLNCNRIRLTADGKLRYCLFAIEEDDVKRLMRSGATDEEIAALVRRNLAGKWQGHEINSAKFVAPPRPMYSIGG